MATDRCCFCCHVLTGTWIVAIVELVMVAIALVQSAYFFIDKHDNMSDSQRIASIINIVIFAIWLALIILLIMALVKKRAGWIIPHLIASVGAFVWCVIQVIILIVNGGTTLGFIVIWILFALLIAYFLYVEYCCYKWMKGEVI